MRKHGWISSVLEDLRIHCDANGLKKTQHSVEAAKQVFEEEKKQKSLSQLSVHEQLLRANSAQH